MTNPFHALMTPIYLGISAILRFWHATWYHLLGGAATNWSWILGIIFVVLTVRAALFPIFVRQIRSQRAMQTLQPKVKALHDKHKGDRETLQRELIQLYRTEKTNPLMGCLPMLVQVPVFLGLYHVLGHLKPTLPLDQKLLYGWTAQQFDSASHATLLGAPLAASMRTSAASLHLLGASPGTVRLVAAVLIAVMIATTVLTTRQMITKTGGATDPQTRTVQRLMMYAIPLSLLVSGSLFPIGVVLYWVTQNLVSLVQQLWVLRAHPPAARE